MEEHLPLLDQDSRSEHDAMGLSHESAESYLTAPLDDVLVDHTRFNPQDEHKKRLMTRRMSAPPIDPLKAARSKAKSDRYIPAHAKSVAHPSYAEQWIKGQLVQNRSRGYGSVNEPHFHNPFASPKRESVYRPTSFNNLEGGQTEATDYFNMPQKSDSTLDFHSSNPSSRRSSRNSSLHDVCFPLEELDDSGNAKVWPDLAILQIFADEEIAELKKLNDLENEGLSRVDEDAESVGSNQAVGFQYPLVSNIDTNVHPRTVSHKINETEPINGRLRPPKIVPWDNKQYSSQPYFSHHFGLQNPGNDGKKVVEQFRFTYFREDLDSTVHSPNISGLLQEGQDFRDLFSISHYSKKPDSTPKKSASTRSTTPQPIPMELSKQPTPLPAEEPVNSDKSPFWLDVLNPTEEEMKVLSKSFGIHPLTTEDIFLGETREKVELFKEYYFVCFRSFDIVQEKYKQKKQLEKVAGSLSFPKGPRSNRSFDAPPGDKGFGKTLRKLFRRKSSGSTHTRDSLRSCRSSRRRERERENKQKGGFRHKPRDGELEPLNMYVIVFRDGILTFHFAPAPHPVNVRRRARLLRDYLTVSSDWICYALIDDITDAFAPMIESIEDEVNAIEDFILSMNSKDSSDEELSDDSENEDYDVEDDKKSAKSFRSRTSTSTSSSSKTQFIAWNRKANMLRRIGECRKRVMSISRLLGSKADVIKGFSKRCNENWDVAPRSEIGMYLGDIQDHIVTMVQSLNHYEKLLARSHSNYLAQINIDMTKVNNDMNDVLGKITILGTVVLPMNIVTGLWGMNVMVPGQNYEGLAWFWWICLCMFLFAFVCYVYTKRVAGI